jgi:hypothetical protein
MRLTAALSLLAHRMTALYAAEAEHKRQPGEYELQEVQRARRIYHLAVIRADRLRQGKQP